MLRDASGALNSKQSVVAWSIRGLEVAGERLAYQLWPGNCHPPTAEGELAIKPIKTAERRCHHLTGRPIYAIVATLPAHRYLALSTSIASNRSILPSHEGTDDRRKFQRESDAAHSLVKPSALHCSEPTPLWTMNSPSGSYFFLISARRE